MLINFGFDSIGNSSVSFWFFVCITIKISKHNQKYDSISQNPIHKERGIVTVHEQQLYRVNGHQQKLGLKYKQLMTQTQEQGTVAWITITGQLLQSNNPEPDLHMLTQVFFVSHVN